MQASASIWSAQCGPPASNSAAGSTSSPCSVRSAKATPISPNLLPLPSREGGGGRGWTSQAQGPGLSLMAAYGFVAGLPLPLSGFTLRLWLSEGGVSLAVIGLTANIALAYSLKFLWAPVLDNAQAPGPLWKLGRRRGWLIAIQPALTAAAALLALSDPARFPFLSLALAALVAFLSASQD